MLATLEVMEIAEELNPGYLAPFTTASSGARSVLFHPAGYSLWEVEAVLDLGTKLHWGVDHGDEVVYVLDGELAINGVHCGRHGAAIVETDVEATALALTPARVLHFGPASPNAPNEGPLGPPRQEAHCVHVVAHEAAELVGDAAGNGARFYSDSTCETCRVAFFAPFAHGAFVTPSHVHTEDEIIRVLDGELQFGRLTVRTGMSIAIPGGFRYGFRSPTGYSFLNYRRDLSTAVIKPGTPALIETLEATRRALSGVE